MQAKPADNALAIEERVARQMRKRRAPLIKTRLIDIQSRSPADERPQGFQDPLFRIIAAAKGALMSEPRRNRLIERRRRDGCCHDHPPQ